MILLHELQVLRIQLFEMAEARGSLTDPEVLAISEAADKLIVMLQQIQRAEMIRVVSTRYALSADGKTGLANPSILASASRQAIPSHD
ncbi:aspartyl-phosphate phosphatase Spo0E family protein [Paenibacillus silvisoli]|uniref:aspartyl-phosphate phosphatase Spo0E family protein n=1 Tax=Paenibacillus silvisoli TaxID=3110539 RepID=UPI002B1BE164|nr:aspartyl-phosphate phosphatase Spo0E family protein [Paenibacillus silvisoli]